MAERRSTQPPRPTEVRCPLMLAPVCFGVADAATVQAQLTELELWIKVTLALTPNPHLALPTTTSYCCLLTIAY